MKTRFIMFNRAGVYYSEDTTTGKQHSLRTKNEAEALTLLHSKNEAHRQPVLNLHIARTYLTATDPEVAKRTWQVPMDEMTKTKTGSTHARHLVAMKDKAFDLIRNLPILETHSAHFLKVLELGSVSTNVYLRRIHNFALDMTWLAWSILPKRQWPKVKFKEKRAITLEEHQRIIAAEVNPERKTLYQLCWHLGASQGDIANLKGEDVDWTNNTVSFTRRKSGVPVLVHLGAEALNVFKDLPAEGVLFPYLSRVRAGDRATEFGQRCRQLGIKGVTLHSYRYAWAERAKVAGMPERFAQEALGHNSKAVHRATSRSICSSIIGPHFSNARFGGRFGSVHPCFSMSCLRFHSVAASIAFSSQPFSNSSFAMTYQTDAPLQTEHIFSASVTAYAIAMTRASCARCAELVVK